MENRTDNIKARTRISNPIVRGFRAIEAVNVVAVITKISRDNIIL